MEELKCLHWNINQRFPVNTPAIVIAEIMRQNADVIILTEFFKTPNYYEILVIPLECCGYKVFLDPRPAKHNIRQVLIAIKSKLIKNQEIPPIYLSDNEDNIKDGEFPNYLRIDLNIHSLPISIIGTRIRIWNSSGEEEQLRRKKQLTTLLNNLPVNRNIIMMGDFNISDDPAFKKKQSKWHFDKDYNDQLVNKSLILNIPLDGFSPFESRFKLDHIVVSKDIAINKIEYFHKKSWPCYGRNSPDHSILISNINMTH